MSGPEQTPAGAAGGGVIGLEDLIALNDEIAALVRAGVPLERGLRDVGGALRGRLGAIAQTLGERMSRGESLAQALDAERGWIPRVYRAVVEAGLRGGRLAAALEGLAGFARRVVELRKAIGLALIYPVLVMMVAYALFVGFVVVIAPRFVEALRSFQIAGPSPAYALARLGETAPYWAPVGPVLLLLLAVGWVRSGRASLLEPGGAGGFLGRIPGMRRLIAQTRSATFADLLALLIEHRVPLSEAVEVSAEVVGDPELRREAAGVAAAMRGGQSVPGSIRGARLFPPLLGWIIITGQAQGNLAPALRQAAQIYRRQAVHGADLLRVVLPTALLLAIGATATALYCLTLFVPFVNLMFKLAEG